MPPKPGRAGSAWIRPGLRPPRDGPRDSRERDRSPLATSCMAVPSLESSVDITATSDRITRHRAVEREPGAHVAEGQLDHGRSGHCEPSRSAASMMPRAARSFFEEPGLR